MDRKTTFVKGDIVTPRRDVTEQDLEYKRHYEVTGVMWAGRGMWSHMVYTLDNTLNIVNAHLLLRLVKKAK